jgi:hypothetical protein
MTDDEKEKIIEELATEVMGWYPPDPSLVPEGHYTYFHDIKSYVDEITDHTISTEVWNKSIYWCDENGNPVKFEGKLLFGKNLLSSFNPIDNVNHWRVVLLKMRELNWSFIMDWALWWDEPLISFIGFELPGDPRADIRDEMGLALCRAALLAVRSIKNE